MTNGDLGRGDRAVQVRDITMDHMIALSEETVTQLEWIIEPSDDGRYRFTLFSRIAETPAWRQHAAGLFSSGHPLAIQPIPA